MYTSTRQLCVYNVCSGGLDWLGLASSSPFTPIVIIHFLNQISFWLCILLLSLPPFTSTTSIAYYFSFCYFVSRLWATQPSHCSFCCLFCDSAAGFRATLYALSGASSSSPSSANLEMHDTNTKCVGGRHELQAEQPCLASCLCVPPPLVSFVCTSSPSSSFLLALVLLLCDGLLLRPYKNLHALSTAHCLIIIFFINIYRRPFFFFLFFFVPLILGL
jgi:hypothetical protein